MGGKGKEQGRRRKYWKWVAVVTVVFVLAVLFRVPLLRSIGQALLSEDPLREADIIVVLMGRIPDRVVHGVDLFHEGYAQQLLMVRTREYEEYEIVETLGLDIPGVVDINRDIALQLGVPEDSLVVLDYGADSTHDEALAVQAYLEEHGGDTVIIATSRYHSARSKKIFQRVLGDGYEVLSSPSPYDPYEPTNWWNYRHQARNVIFEYQKLVNLYLFGW